MVDLPRRNLKEIIRLFNILKEFYPDGCQEDYLQKKGFNINLLIMPPKDFFGGSFTSGITYEIKDKLVIKEGFNWKITKLGLEYLRDLERDEILKEQKELSKKQTKFSRMMVIATLILGLGVFTNIGIKFFEISLNRTFLKLIFIAVMLSVIGILIISLIIDLLEYFKRKPHSKTL